MPDGTVDNGNGRMLARIDERVKAIDKKLDTICADIKDDIHDHEDRLRTQEDRTVWTQIIGGLVALGLGGWSLLSK